jgi:fucose permease
VLVIAAAATLLIGLVRDDAGTIALGLASVVAALIVVWAGVVRISGSSQGHRQR